MPNAKLKCKYCKEYQPRDEMIRVPAGVFCNINEAIEFASNKQKKNAVIKQKKANSEKKAKNKAFDKRVKENDVPRQLELTQKVFNKLRKLQEFKWFADQGLPPTCISCGKENMDWCCGHLKTVGSQGAIRFDKMNTYLQCNRYCNKGLSGNISGNKTTHGYIKGLMHRFGSKRAQEIVDYCEVYRIKKWSGPGLIAMRKEMNIEIRQLEKEL